MRLEYKRQRQLDKVIKIIVRNNSFKITVTEKSVRVLFEFASGIKHFRKMLETIFRFRQLSTYAL